MIFVQLALHQGAVVDICGSKVDILDHGVRLRGKRSVQSGQRTQFPLDQEL